jgi:cobalt-zinc-cadmium efflux system outer membrane protein
MKKYIAMALLACQFAYPNVAISAEEVKILEASQVWPTDLINFVNSTVKDHPQSRAMASAVSSAYSQASTYDQPIANPELDIEGTNRSSEFQPDGSKPETERTRQIGLSITTDFGIKQSINTNLGRFEIIIAENNLKQSVLDLSGQVISALSTYYYAKKEASLSERQKKAMERFIAQAKKLRSVGETSATDLSLAKLALAETLREDLSAKGRLMEAQADLLSLCQCSIDSLPKLPAKFPMVVKPDFDDILQTLPSIKAAQANVEKAKIELKLTKANLIPDPTFSISGGREGKVDFVTFGVSVPIPVLRTGRPEIQAQKEALITAENEKQAEWFVRERQVTSSYRSYALALRTLSLWQNQNFQSIEEQARLLGRLWKAGEISTTEYLVKIQETIEASKTGLRLKGQAWDAFSRWLVDSNELSFFLGAQK